MQHRVYQKKSFAIAYDASIVENPGVELFSAGYWESRQSLAGEAMGRGSAWFIDAPFGPVVLRQYLRGGWVAKISHQNYLFTTVARSRPFREFDVLAALYEQGLPVPRPVAALCEYHGLTSTGAIMTGRIPGAHTLVQFFPGNDDGDEPGSALWSDVGRCIRKFHDAGLWHADLNARNILLDDERQAYLIDFDRARLTPGQPVDGKRNLERLKRSLDKLWPRAHVAAMQPRWMELLAGYHG